MKSNKQWRVTYFLKNQHDNGEQAEFARLHDLRIFCKEILKTSDIMYGKSEKYDFRIMHYNNYLQRWC